MRTVAATFLALSLSLSIPVVALNNDGTSPGPQPKSSVTAPPTRQTTVWRGERISLSLKDADLGEVLRSFARLAGVNLVIDPVVRGKVTVELHDVPWDQALSVILKSQRLGVEVSGGNVWRLGPGNASAARPLLGTTPRLVDQPVNEPASDPLEAVHQ